MSLGARERRSRPRKDLRKHVNHMRRLASHATEGRDPRDPRPVPSPPWWSTVFSSRYKTEMCHHLVEEGVCSFGDGCVYAHSVHELRPIKRHPKHRSELCKDYHQDGYCSFGARCSFIHTKPDLEELKSSLQPTPKVPMPENPRSAVKETDSSGYKTSSPRSSDDQDSPPTPSSKKRKTSASELKGDAVVVMPLPLKATLFETPLEPGFRHRWGRRRQGLWKELPPRRLAIFEQLCPQLCARSQD
ncbi:protein TIS11-like [Ornithodoros turicata]|uniref:protein TIS11-like n=1 Tax=Ornithodoros turicata TaxID=34597 RepID=UPI00313948C0